MLPTAPDILAAIVEGSCGDPFATLGIHPVGRRGSPGIVVRAFLPDAASVAVARGDALLPMRRVHPEGFFELVFSEERTRFDYSFVVTRSDGAAVAGEDPYRFGPVLDEAELLRFERGAGVRVDRFLGAHPRTHEGVGGVSFAVWAPNAVRVGVMGSFNRWEGRRHPMRRRGRSGVWELFVPGLWIGALYKYEILTAHEGQCTVKSDPVGFAMEVRPSTASIVTDLDDYAWGDARWLTERAARQSADQPISIYEVHLGSWKRGARPPANPGVRGAGGAVEGAGGAVEGGEGGEGAAPFLTYEEIASELIPYAREMGFTHLELLPVAEHPFDGSWGYQSAGYFAPTSRFGTPNDFRRFVDAAHQAGLGVILDWVPGHFPKDAHGLGYFDGTHLYEHADPRQGVHRDWGTYVYNYGRPQVTAFLLSSALFWIERYHVDGLRVDAVASMLYLDYSRQPGEWVPNEHGGRENLEAVAFLKAFNALVHRDYPGVLTFAEESTSWPGVTAPSAKGGLGFDFKWNMGWMNDTLAYMKLDPLLRKGSQRNLTFSLHYAFTERFLLPLSHDEVVHGKRSLVSRMPGEVELQLANLTALFCWQWLHPGKKLLFMGGEIGQWREWDFEGELDWALLGVPAHRRVRTLVASLNALYRGTPALHEIEADWRGFEWIDFTDAPRSIVSFLRRGKQEGDVVVAVLNFTPVEWKDYRVGVPAAGKWKVVFDSRTAGAADEGTGGADPAGESERPRKTARAKSSRKAASIAAKLDPLHEQPASLAIDVPPLGAVVLAPGPRRAALPPAPATPRRAAARSPRGRPDASSSPDPGGAPPRSRRR